MLLFSFLVAAKWNSLTPLSSVWGLVSFPICETSIVTAQSHLPGLSSPFGRPHSPRPLQDNPAL